MSTYTDSGRKSSEGAGLAFIVYLVTAVPRFLWNGFVLKTIWNWFVPNIFLGAPTLSIAQALGLSLVVSIFTYKHAPTSDKQSALEAVLISLFNSLLVGCIALLFGLIVHSFL